MIKSSVSHVRSSRDLDVVYLDGIVHTDEKRAFIALAQQLFDQHPSYKSTEDVDDDVIRFNDDDDDDDNEQHNATPAVQSRNVEPSLVFVCCSRMFYLFPENVYGWCKVSYNTAVW